jgi:pyruvate/2-oxoglutarate dehydrogenase complex dihydrolipoamide acyltransferase (E2) component
MDRNASVGSNPTFLWSANPGYEDPTWSVPRCSGFGSLACMAKEFLLPDIGEGLTEAEVVRWLVSVGDVIAVDQLIVEVETAKTVVEIPSPFAGTIASLGAPEGATVEVGSVLFTVASEGDGRSEPTALATSAPVAQPAEPASTPTPRTESAEPKAKAMPIVRRLAEERGVDLASIVGTGTGGTITRADVEAAAAPSPTAGELVPLTPTRRAIADHMARSWAEIPHVAV